MNAASKTLSALKGKALSELKAIALEMGVEPAGDRRLKQSWISAIEEQRVGAAPKSAAESNDRQKENSPGGGEAGSIGEQCQEPWENTPGVGVQSAIHSLHIEQVPGSTQLPDGTYHWGVLAGKLENYFDYLEDASMKGKMDGVSIQNFLASPYNQQTVSPIGLQAQEPIDNSPVNPDGEGDPASIDAPTSEPYFGRIVYGVDTNEAKVKQSAIGAAQSPKSAQVSPSQPKSFNDEAPPNRGDSRNRRAIVDGAIENSPVSSGSRARSKFTAPPPHLKPGTEVGHRHRSGECLGKIEKIYFSEKRQKWRAKVGPANYDLDNLVEQKILPHDFPSPVGRGWTKIGTTTKRCDVCNIWVRKVPPHPSMTIEKNWTAAELSAKQIWQVRAIADRLGIKRDSVSGRSKRSWIAAILVEQAILVREEPAAKSAPSKQSALPTAQLQLFDIAEYKLPKTEQRRSAGVAK